MIIFYSYLSNGWFIDISYIVCFLIMYLYFLPVHSMLFSGLWETTRWLFYFIVLLNKRFFRFHMYLEVFLCCYWSVLVNSNYIFKKSWFWRDYFFKNGWFRCHLNCVSFESFLDLNVSIACHPSFVRDNSLTFYFFVYEKVLL